MEVISNLRIAVVCANNINRSMKAHETLSKKGFNVRSFGTSSVVRLPGPNPTAINAFSFGTSYEDIHQQLVDQNEDIYEKTGVLDLLIRNKNIKPMPERFQGNQDKFDIILTCEKHVYKRVITDLKERVPEDHTVMHVININIEDNQAEASAGAELFYNLLMILSQSTDMNNEIGQILQDYEEDIDKPILHWICYN